MRILIFGGNGMLGHKLIQVLGRESEVWCTVRGKYDRLRKFGLIDAGHCLEGVDVENTVSVRNAIGKVRPDVVINASGIVKQLPTSKNVVRTLSVNSIFPHELAEFADEFGFRLFCISTDCVFDGARGNYVESDTSNASDLYGRSKNLGEVLTSNSITIRTSIIGRELISSHSLVEWFLSNRGGHVKGFENAIYTGFPTIVLADIIKGLIFQYPELSGLYHVSSDRINKYELIHLLNEAFDTRTEIERDLEFKIDRSLNSAKFRSVTGFVPESWEIMIEKLAGDPTPYDIWRK